MNTYNLDGDWNLVLDTENKGITNRWYNSVPEKSKTVQIPHFLDTSISSIAFYYKKFSLAPRDKKCLLRFERAASYIVIWVNGKQVGEHFGAWSAFEFDISHFVHLDKENLLCVRVSTPPENGELNFISSSDTATAEQMPMGEPWFKKPFAGLIGDVSLVATKNALLTNAELICDPDRERVHLKLDFINSRNYTVKFSIFLRNTKNEYSEIKTEHKLDKDNGSCTMQLGLKEIHLWSPENPNLYGIEICLENSNSMHFNFGFKKFDCKRGDFYLNDSIIKLQGITYNKQGLENEKPEILLKELTAIKKMNFNAIRSGGAPLSQKALDICDEIGLLVFQELPICKQKLGKMSLSIAKTIIPKIIKEGHNHASLAVWLLGSENGELILDHSSKLLHDLAICDSIHPAISNVNCVYIDNEQKYATDIGKVLCVTDSGILSYNFWHKLNLSVLASAQFSLFLSNYGQKQDEDFLIPDSFFGSSRLQDNYEKFADGIKGKLLLSLKSSDILHKHQAVIKKLKKFIEKNDYGIWDGVERFIADARNIAISGIESNIQSLQSANLISGYFLENFADYKNDLSGLFTENRDSKGLESFVKNITAPTRLLISALERAVAPNESISFQLSFLNEKRIKSIDVQVQILNSKGDIEHSQKKNFSTQTSLTQLGDFSIKAPATEGDYTLKISLLNENEAELVHSIEEPIAVIKATDIKEAFNAVEFIDNAENSEEILRMLNSKKQILFTSALSSWAGSIINNVVSTVKNGKTLFISDISSEDIDLINGHGQLFDFKLNSHYSSGATGISLHFVTKDSPLKNSFCGRSILDKTCAEVVSSISLEQVKNSKPLVHSVSLKNGEFTSGIDLQILPLGNGKIILSTLNFSLLETKNVLTNNLFADIVKEVS